MTYFSGSRWTETDNKLPITAPIPASHRINEVRIGYRIRESDRTQPISSVLAKFTECEVEVVGTGNGRPFAL